MSWLGRAWDRATSGVGSVISTTAKVAWVSFAELPDNLRTSGEYLGGKIYDIATSETTTGFTRDLGMMTDYLLGKEYVPGKDGQAGKFEYHTWDGIKSVSSDIWHAWENDTVFAYGLDHPGRAASLTVQGLSNSVTGTAGMVLDAGVFGKRLVYNLGAEEGKAVALTSDPGESYSERFKEATRFTAEIDPNSPDKNFERIFLFGGEAIGDVGSMILTGGATAGILGAGNAVIKGEKVVATSLKWGKTTASFLSPLENVAEVAKVAKVTSTNAIKAAEEAAKALEAITAAGGSTAEIARATKLATRTVAAAEKATAAAEKAEEVVRIALETKSKINPLYQVSRGQAAIESAGGAFGYEMKMSSAENEDAEKAKEEKEGRQAAALESAKNDACLINTERENIQGDPAEISTMISKSCTKFLTWIKDTDDGIDLMNNLKSGEATLDPTILALFEMDKSEESIAFLASFQDAREEHAKSVADAEHITRETEVDTVRVEGEAKERITQGFSREAEPTTSNRFTHAATPGSSARNLPSLSQKGENPLISTIHYAFTTEPQAPAQVTEPPAEAPAAETPKPPAQPQTSEDMLQNLLTGFMGLMTGETDVESLFSTFMEPLMALFSGVEVKNQFNDAAAPQEEVLQPAIRLNFVPGYNV